MSLMKEPNSEQLYFDALKEARGSYFVEYQPPVSSNPFATLNLVYPGAFALPKVAEDMRSEMDHWLARYRVPLMVSAFDVAENVIRPHGNNDDASLVGWHAPGTDEVISSWKLDELSLYLKQPIANADWRSIYTDIPHRTQTQVTENAEKEISRDRKQNRILRGIFVFWLSVIPAAWAVMQYLGPEWLAIAILIYSLWKAWLTGNKLLGHVKTFRSEEEKAEKQRKMDHYFYHCERNPEGFSRLKVEDFERDIGERTRREAESLAAKPK